MPIVDCAGDKTPREDTGLWFTAIVDSSNDAIISKRLDGVITTWNAAAEKLFGYSEAEAVSQPITLIIPADLHDEEKDILKQLRAASGSSTRRPAVSHATDVSLMSRSPSLLFAMPAERSSGPPKSCRTSPRPSGFARLCAKASDDWRASSLA